MTRIIGVDPGLTATGWGVIDGDVRASRHVAHGVVRTKASDGLAQRLLAIRDAVGAAARLWRAEAAAIEVSFVGNNASSALSLGHARAAALIGLAEAGLAVHEYTPATVKQTVAGYGQGEKAQVALMVALQLGLERSPSPADAADALAVALTHWAHGRYA